MCPPVLLSTSQGCTAGPQLLEEWKTLMNILARSVVSKIKFQNLYLNNFNKIKSLTVYFRVNQELVLIGNHTD